MRVLELEIRNVRGIPSLSLEPGGRNLVIWGPNGSGKSAVVDAIDFLLTGRISRLTGEGTGDITLKRHGPHVDHQPGETMVRAVLRLPGLADPVELRRSIERPDELGCDPPAGEHLDTVLAVARQGQHVLTRRDILRLIAADTNTRARQIQELMNLSGVEKIRGALVSAHNRLGDEFGVAELAYGRALGAVIATAQVESFEEAAVLDVVNDKRAILGGLSVRALGSACLKEGLSPQEVASGAGAAEIAVTRRYIQNLQRALEAEHEALVAGSDERLRTLLGRVRSEPELLRAVKRLGLTELGLGLIDESGRCPLCDAPWPAGELRRYLEERMSSAKVASGFVSEISRAAQAIKERLTGLMESLRKVAEAAQGFGLKNDFLKLEGWLFALQEFSRALGDPLERYDDPRFSRDEVKRMLAPAGIEENLDDVAWDILTRLEENLKAAEGAKKTFLRAGLSHRRAVVLLECFLAARDSVLGRLYESIRDRFVGLYRRLHEAEEGEFSARIEPEKAGLNFEVDFFGRGLHPPRALHSEGHQDSMGLCLYLALAEHFTKGVIDLVMLDDVVMSIDADHRREVCSLLATEFAHRQLLITTHDRTWATQLRTEGVAGPNGVVEFYGWDLETGPHVSQNAGLWGRILADLEGSDVPSAAAKLRRGMEEFLGGACDSLQGKVTFKLSGRWELGDFLPSAMHCYRDLLKR
jgi:energy-coupling factor transporter ATP-binding protein EcfA2